MFTTKIDLKFNWRSNENVCKVTGADSQKKLVEPAFHDKSLTEICQVVYKGQKGFVVQRFFLSSLEWSACQLYENQKEHIKIICLEFSPCETCEKSLEPYLRWSDALEEKYVFWPYIKGKSVDKAFEVS